MGMQFVVIDETNGATTTSGEKLDPRTLEACCRIFTIYLNRLVGSYWGIPGGAMVRAASSPSDIQTGEWPSHVVPALPNVPNAVAYHEWLNGKADIYDGITLSDNLLGPGGWTSAMTHELAETVGDVETNIMRRDNAGHLYDQEVCDPIEVQSFPMTLNADGSLAATPNTKPGFADDGSFTCYVANFALEAYFTPGGTPPFDYMTAAGLPGANGPTAPFTPVPSGGGDYQMLETDPGDDTQVTAMRAHGSRKHVLGKTTHRQAHKAHFTSRPYRRGLRVPMPPPKPAPVEAPPAASTGDSAPPPVLAALLESAGNEAHVETPPPAAPDSTADSVRGVLDDLSAEAQRLGLYEAPAAGGAVAPPVQHEPSTEDRPGPEETKPAEAGASELTGEWQEKPL